MLKNFMLLRIIKVAAIKFLKDDCFILAGSISFVFLLSVIPFSTLSIFIFDVIQRIILAHTGWSGNAAEILSNELVQIIPFVSRQWVSTHVINPEAYSSFKTINFLLLPIISGLIFKTLESSYRKIFQLSSRHLLLGQAVYAIMSIFAVLLFFMFNFIYAILTTMASHVVNILNKTPYFKNIYATVVDYLTIPHLNWVSMLVLMLFFLTTVKIFLKTKIQLRYQLGSGIIFCLLWILARQLFGLYITHISEVNVLYGSLSSVVVILLWIFYSSIALLFSIEVMYVMHSGWYRRW